MATDAKQSGEDVPKSGRPNTVDAAPVHRKDTFADLPELEMLHRKARAALEQTLAPGEQVRLVIPGLVSAAIVATDRRAFVFKAGAKAGLPFSARLKEFEYESVIRVDLRPAGEVDVVVIHAPLKISSCSSYWADPRDDPWKARNAIALTRGSVLAAGAVEELSRLVAAFNDRGPSSRPRQAPGSKRSDERTPDVVGHIAELEQSGARKDIGPVARDEGKAAAAEPECARCGSELGAGWQFCPRCGAPAKPRRHDRIGAQRRRRLPGRST